MFASRIVKDIRITLATAMTHCRLLGNLTFAIKFLRLFDSHGKSLDSISLAEFFKLLCDRRRPIMLSAVWRYAQHNGVMAFDMKKRGSDFQLAFRSTAEPTQETSEWQARRQTRAAQLFRHIEGGFSEEEHRTLLQALFPWPAGESPTVSNKPGVHQHHGSEAFPRAPIVDENCAGIDNSVVDLMLDWLNELDGMAKDKKIPLSRLLVKAERRDNQLARIKANAPGILARRRMKHRGKHENGEEENRIRKVPTRRLPTTTREAESGRRDTISR
jgi:hypothetical protein